MKQYFKAQYYIPVIGLVFISLYALLLITGGESQGRARRNSLNQGESGYSLFYKLFKQLGYTMRRWYEAELPQKGGCLFYFDYYPPDRDRDSQDRQDKQDSQEMKDKQDLVKKMTQWVKQGNTLFLVGIHSGFDPFFSHQVKEGPARKVSITGTTSTSPSYHFSFSRSRFFESKSQESQEEVLMESESGPLSIRRPLGNGAVFLFADNNLFANHYFLNPHHALFLNDLLKNYYTDAFYVYEYGSSAGVYKVRNPVMILFKGDLLWVTLHLFLVGLIFVMWMGKRFGKPIHANPFKRRSIGVHLAAVGDFYQKTKAYKIVESLTRKYFIYRVKQVLNLKKNLSPGELADLLAGYSGVPVEKIKILLEEPTGIPEPMMVLKRRDIHKVIMAIKAYKR